MIPTIVSPKDWEAKIPEELEVCTYCEGDGLVECGECGEMTKQCRHCRGLGESKKASGYYRARNSDQEKYRRWCEMMGVSQTVITPAANTKTKENGNNDTRTDI